MDRRQFLSTGPLAVASTVPGAALASPRGLSDQAQSEELTLVPARKADDLCESYCINTKLFYNHAVYGYTDAVIDLVKELGVRIVRERVAPGRSAGARKQQYAMPLLAEAGTRWHGTVGRLRDASAARAVNKQTIDFLSSYYAEELGLDLALLLHSLGGCNEVDGPVVEGRRDPQWAAHARLMQQALWTEAKLNPLTSAIPVVGPSTRTDVTADRAAELGDLSAWCDRFGNAHMYNHGRSPTRGIDEQLAILHPCFPDAERWFFTETGYNNSPQSNAGRTVPEEASATYAIRGICDFFKRNAIYGRFELLDDPDRIDAASLQSVDRTADRQAHFGLVAMTEDDVQMATPETWRRKPEFYSTQRFLALMSDRGDAFEPAPLGLSVIAGTDDLQQLLVQKRDGRHYLLLWRDIEVATVYPDARLLYVAPDMVTVRLEYARSVVAYEPGTGAEPIALWESTDSVTVPVAGELTVLELL